MSAFLDTEVNYGGCRCRYCRRFRRRCRYHERGTIRMMDGPTDGRADAISESQKTRGTRLKMRKSFFSWQRSVSQPI